MAYDVGISTYIDRSKRLFGLTQSSYMDKIQKMFSIEQSKERFVSISHSVTLLRDICPKVPVDIGSIQKIPDASAI